MWGIIATWTMAQDGINKASELLNKGVNCTDSMVQAIKDVEDCPFYKSVGYGGLPNEDGIVELDAGYMNGTDLSVGAVGAIYDIESPIEVAVSLSKSNVNNILVGKGATLYAIKNGFKQKNMLSDRAYKLYQKRLEEEKKELKPYIGHDTVGMVCLDQDQHMCAGTSTSGLFMKKEGRIGDSPVVGSGFYCDEEIGGATATGLGEDLMKGCISYEIVSLMKRGLSPQEACDIAVSELNDKLARKRQKAGDLSVVAMNNKGEWGVATNIDNFSFAVSTSNQETTVYFCKHENGKTTYEQASKEFLEEYYATRRAAIV